MNKTMTNHKIIRPNIFYAIFVQVLTLLIYVSIAVLCYRLITYFLGIDILSEIYSIIKSLDILGAGLILEFIIDNVQGWVIITMMSLILLLINIVNERIEITDDKITLNNGFILIKKEEFLLNEIVRYNAIRDLNFLNTGSIELFTIYGDRIKIDYILNLNNATRYLDILVNNNKKHIKHNTKINLDPESFAKDQSLNFE